VGGGGGDGWGRWTEVGTGGFYREKVGTKKELFSRYFTFFALE
jgi:hypothetical protein